MSLFKLCGVIFLTAIVFISSGCSIIGVRTTDEPAFETIASEPPFEIRDYGEMLLAEVETETSFDDASNEAFRVLFKYISGANLADTKIEMTAPVFMDSSELTSSTRILTTKAQNAWKMAFVLPDEYRFKDVPEPEDSRVKIKRVRSSKVATIRFSGSWDLEKLQRKTEDLQNWISKIGYESVSEPRAAGFDPPWTIPFLKRNEIHIDVRKKDRSQFE